MNMHNIALPSMPDSGILRRLIRARQFLEHAKSHAASGTEFDCMIATHGADNAIEFTLKLIADHVRYEEVSGNTLPETELAQIAGVLFKYLRENHQITLPYFQEIKALRQMRNLVQHGNFTPGSEIERQIVIADRFFSRICTSIFGLNASQLRVASIVTNEIIQGQLKLAEDALDEKRWEDCVRACRNAFEEALFHYRKDSPITSMEIPARLRIGKLGYEVERYIVLLSEEMDALRLKIDSNYLQRYKDIVKHIPNDPDIDPSGHFVLQRPWMRSDAEYCYGFVCDNVLRWQSGEFEPLYEPEHPDLYRQDETINGISLSEGEIGCVYHEQDHVIYLLYATRILSDKLVKLETDKVYAWNSKHYKNDVLDIEINCQIRLRFVRCELVTHDPARWKVVLDISREPLTWHRRDYENGSIVKETPSLQSCTKEELEDLYPMDAASAQRVIDAREKHGMLNFTLLQQIELTESQMQWIEKFMRI